MVQSHLLRRFGRGATRITAKAPGVALAQQLFYKAMVECVSTAIDANVTVDGNAQQGQIADQVQHFVANELVAPTQAFRVHHPLCVQHDGVRK